jgi:hypothetical protein
VTTMWRSIVPPLVVCVASLVATIFAVPASDDHGIPTIPRVTQQEDEPANLARDQSGMLIHYYLQPHPLTYEFYFY